MTHTRLLSLLPAVLLLSCAFAGAQDQLTLKPRTESPADSIWPRYSVYEGEKLVVVATAHPKDRQTCKVKSIDENELVCAKSHGQTVSFPKDDVAALIRPGESESHWGAFLGGGIIATIGAAIFYSAIVVASISTPLIAVAVPVALVGAILGVEGLGLPFAFLGDGATGDSLIYHRAGETLQVAVRT